MLTSLTNRERSVSAPPLQYHGAKWTIAPFIIEHFPTHRAYCEPFGGSACVLLSKKPSTIEIYNDLYLDVVNFFRVLREQPNKLVRAIQLTPNARREYLRAYDALKSPLAESASAATRLERARVFYVSTQQSFCGMRKWDSAWRTSKVSRTNVLRWLRVEHLYEIADRLRPVQIECRDVFDIFDKYDSPETLFYLDPPYLKSTRSRKAGLYVVEAGDDAFHRELAARVHELRGMALVSGYPSALYDELYADFHVARTRSRDRMNIWREECLWISPRTRARHIQQKLF